MLWIWLAAEKKAREELADTIMMVKAASEKVQEEVRRLQLENVQLQQMITKLRSEQGEKFDNTWEVFEILEACPPRCLSRQLVLCNPCKRFTYKTGFFWLFCKIIINSLFLRIIHPPS